MYNIWLVLFIADASLKRIRLHFLCFAFKCFYCLGMPGFPPLQSSWETLSHAASLSVLCQSNTSFQHPLMPAFMGQCRK